MSRPDWKKIGRLFDAALEMPRERRDPYLEGECQGEPEVLREVRSMLRAHERAEGVLDATLGSMAAEALDEASTRLVRGQTVGPFELVREIGRGGMGVVYQARDRRLDRDVALKFLPKLGMDARGAAERFLGEARAASALDHPGICTIFDVGETPDHQLYIAMAYYEGETLAEVLDRGPVPGSQALDVLRQILEALAHSHERGIVHRDIKPSNVFLTRAGDVKILDFGIAKLEGAARLTQPGVKVGTLAYMSPEQARGEATDARSDLWSAGVVFHEMLTGELPFGGSHDAAVLHSILYDEPAPLDVSAYSEIRGVDALSELWTLLLSKDLDRRAASARDVLNRFDELLTQQSERAPRQRPSRKVLGPSLPRATPSPPPRRSRESPAPAGAPRTSTPLPVVLTAFLGRQKEILEVRELLRTCRLLTLTGLPGTGKTRLALEVAEQVRGRFRDDVLFVPLAGLDAAADLPRALARALGLVDTAHQGLLESIIEHMGSREQLIIFDNFEHVVEAAPVLAEVLSRCPGISAMVTSQVVLRVSGEHAYQVPPLDVPADATSATPHQVDACAATALFVDRARAVRPEFRVDEESAPVIAEICARLDGVPLAIELAAARTRLFPPVALLTRLEHRLDVLKAGPRDRPARHQTLRQAIGWTYDLLAEEDQRCFRVLSLFEGGVSLEAAEPVAQAVGGFDIMDSLGTLVDHSLVRQQTQQSDPRFVMLEIIREFGLERLSEEGENEEVARAHAECFLELVERAAGELTGGEQRSWLRALDVDRGNVRRALEYWRATGDGDHEMRMGAALWRYWLLRGQLREGAQALQRALAGVDGVPNGLSARTRFGLGTLLHNLGENAAAKAEISAVLEYYREQGDAEGIADTLNNLAWVACELAEFDDALRLGADGLEANRKIGQTRALAVALNNMGWACAYTGRVDESVRYHEESLELRRRHGDVRGGAFALANLAQVHALAGRTTAAEPLLDEAEQVATDLQDYLILGWVLTGRCLVAWGRDDLAGAAAAAERAQRASRKGGNRSGVAIALTLLARVRLDVAEQAGVFDGPGSPARTRWGEEVDAILAEAIEMSTGAIPWPEALARVERGRLWFVQGDRQKGWAELVHALRMRANMGAIPDLAESLEWMAKLDPDEPRGNRALQTATALRAWKGVPRPPVVARRLADLQARLGADGDVSDSAGDTERLHGNGPLEAAREVVALYDASDDSADDIPELPNAEPSA